MGTQEDDSPEAAFDDPEWRALGLSRKDVETLLRDVEDKLHLTNSTARRRVRRGFPQLEPYGEGRAVLSIAVEPQAVPAGIDPEWQAFYVVQVSALSHSLSRLHFSATQLLQLSCSLVTTPSAPALVVALLLRVTPVRFSAVSQNVSASDPPTARRGPAPCPPRDPRLWPHGRRPLRVRQQPQARLLFARLRLSPLSPSFTNCNQATSEDPPLSTNGFSATRSGDPDAEVSAAIASLRPGQAYVAYCCFQGGAAVHSSDVFVATGGGGPPLWDPHLPPWLTDERARAPCPLDPLHFLPLSLAYHRSPACVPAQSS